VLDERAGEEKKFCHYDSAAVTVRDKTILIFIYALLVENSKNYSFEKQWNRRGKEFDSFFVTDNVM